ncbi:kinase-like domain-containing protein [Rhizophagus diaphanus]|nr:kinase-like domain-containing protein [Rhizophagus diaphanus] [Rhizophagus sp. MUCL 43196]
MNTDNDPFDPTPNLKSSPVPVLFIPFKNNEEKCNYCGNEYSKSLKYDQKYCKNCLFWYVQYITGNNKYLDAHIITNNSQCIKHKATRNDFYTTNIQEWCEYCSKILYFIQVVVKNSNCKIVRTIMDASKTYCQKWCSRCFIIYTGCRYCLTTNIIFGIADQSQCKKCKRILIIRIEITDIRSGNCIIDEFLDSIRFDNENFHNYIYTSKTIRSPFEIYSSIKGIGKPGIGWIPYSQITNLKKIAEGGFSIIYKATWEGTDVAVKKLHDSQNISKYFLNELRSLYQCNDNNKWVIGCYGITQDPITKEYMIILNYAEGGNLHDYLQKNFINTTWIGKLNILRRISFGLLNIHNKDFIHRDFHSGNMLKSNFWKVGDLGLSQPANNTLSNNEIYGVIPYIAPEIFRGTAFSKESDVYSFGMIMWELTTGCKPFANVEHDHNLILKILDGERPKITEDTPERYADLMKKCWDSNPSKRPTIDKIHNTICTTIWYQIEQAEKKRLELIQLKKLGPEFSERSHPKAIYTSRALSDLISKASTLDSMVSFNMKQEYITQEYEFDIDNIQRSSIQNTNSATQSLIVPVNSSRKRNFEELKNETNENQKNRKYTKVDNSNDEFLNIIELI